MRFGVAMAHMSRAGRVYERGKALNEDLRRNIIQDVVEKGGDLVTGYFPGSFSEIALKNRTTYNTVRKIWKQFFETGITRYESLAAGSKHLQQDDLDFIRFLKTSRASMATGEVYRYVNEFCNVAGGTSNAAIQRALRNHLTDGRWRLGRDSHNLSRRNLAQKMCITVNNLSITFIQLIRTNLNFSMKVA